MSEIYRATGNIDPNLFFLRVTLGEPVGPDGQHAHFTDECARVLSSAQPLSARNWSVKVQGTAQFTIRTSVEAASEREAAHQVLSAIQATFNQLSVRPGRVALMTPSGETRLGIAS
jgi:hypothetical protein